MNPIHIFILSAVEGITEFLPISSTGHLILVSKILNLESGDFLKTFEIVIQFGAILAVVALYFRTLLTRKNLVKKLIVAFIPTAIVGFTLYPLIKDILLGSSAITLNALFWGGVALIGIEWILKKSKVKSQKSKVSVAEVNYRQALLIGVFQSFSVIPGVSRAAATIVGGLLTGLNRESATEFSFLLAVPTMFAASSFDIYRSRQMLISSDLASLIFGTILSFIFALIAVKFLIGYVKKHDFTAFGIYRIILAVIFWIFIK